MLTGIITQDNKVILSDDGYPIIESDKPSVPEYCKAVSRYTETNGKIIQSWEVALDTPICRILKEHDGHSMAVRPREGRLSRSVQDIRRP